MSLHPIFENILAPWQSPQPPSQMARRAGGDVTENQTLGGGTQVAERSGMNMRGKFIEYHGNNRATFECTEGHRSRMKCVPDAPGGRKASEAAIQLQVRWWSRTGIRFECPQCARQRLR